jgi:hypothetical protein
VSYGLRFETFKVISSFSLDEKEAKNQGYSAFG